MTDRVIDLANGPANLSVRDAQLVIRQEEALHHMPLDEVAVLVLSHRQISCTQAVFSGLMEAGAVVIVCDGAALPSGWMLPVCNHHLQTERFEMQITAAPAANRRVWRQIVQAKIRAQACALADLKGGDGGLAALAAHVKPDDTGNVEARAARKYWGSLFEGVDFRRDRKAGGANAMLNYGYMVLRAIVARAVCAAGLHPGIGIHHHNRYNPFPLADDLMEPMRPAVDRTVYAIVGERGADAPLDKEAKRTIVAALLGRYPAAGERRTLFDLSNRCAVSLVRIYYGEGKELELPDAELGPVEV